MIEVGCGVWGVKYQVMMVYNRYDNRINVINTKHLVSLVYLTHQRQSKHQNKGVFATCIPHDLTLQVDEESVRARGRAVGIA